MALFDFLKRKKEIEKAKEKKPAKKAEKVSAVKPMAKNVSAVTTEIQMGDNTHHQDQSMTPVNLRTTNAMVSNPTKPTEDELELLLMWFLL